MLRDPNTPSYPRPKASPSPAAALSSPFSLFSSSSQRKQGAAARAGPLSSARLFVLVLLCSPAQPYVRPQLVSRFFHIRAHANISSCWRATAGESVLWSLGDLLCSFFFFSDTIACSIARRRRRFLASGACLGLSAGGSDKGTSWGPKRRDAGREGSWERKPGGRNTGNNKAGWKRHSKRARREENEGARDGKSVNKTKRAALSGAPVGVHAWSGGILENTNLLSHFLHPSARSWSRFSAATRSSRVAVLNLRMGVCGRCKKKKVSNSILS